MIPKTRFQMYKFVPNGTSLCNYMGKKTMRIAFMKHTTEYLYIYISINSSKMKVRLKIFISQL